MNPVSIASLVMGTMLSESVSLVEDPILYLKLAFTVTFFVGLFQASLGLLSKMHLISFNLAGSEAVGGLYCSRLHPIQVPESDIGNHFGMSLEDEEGSDITFNVFEEKFPAPRVLAARSPVFEAEFSDRMEEDDNEIVVTDVEPKATLGFMAVAAVIVSLHQLKGLLGIVHFIDKMTSVFQHKKEDQVLLMTIYPFDLIQMPFTVVLASYCNGIQLPVVSVDSKAYCAPFPPNFKEVVKTIFKAKV
ncbi:hypothetical protein REPUB_Repub15cG0034100 [Reevesia pubescens]